MSQAQRQNEPIGLPPRMKAALEQYQKQVWMVKIAEGLLAGIFGLVISYLLVFCFDRFFDTPAILRGLILIVGCVGMAVLFPLKMHNWVWSHRRLDQIARLTRHRFPRFGDHLLGIIELAQSETGDGKSRSLVVAAIEQVDNELEERDLSDAVPNPLHRRWAWIAGIPLAVAALLLLLIPAAGTNALARWLTPWRDVDRYTFAQLDDDSGRKVVPYAEPFSVQANLKTDSPWKPATAQARFENQKPLITKREGESYLFDIPPQTDDGSVAIKVGDAYQSVPVEPKTRPALSDLIAEVQLPAYLQQTDSMVADARGGNIGLVKGSTAVLKMTATRELTAATLNDRPQTIDEANVVTEPLSIDATRDYTIAWWDTYGLSAREPQVLRIEAVDDLAPNVRFDNMQNNKVLLATEVISFEIEATDDFGVKRLGLEWSGIEDPIENPQPSVGEKLVASGDPSNDSIKVPATFAAQREGIQPQSLRLRAYAEDYLPGRQRAYSPYLVLHVLDAEDHFKWVTDQLAKWTDASKEVYEKELQLHDKNEELMNLPDSELDKPETKKEIQQQAAAEQANAAKLDALIDVGKQLVQEAAKNEEFDPKQLAMLAEILQQLEEIAGEKMPSVAELLKEAADAPPGKPGKPPQKDPLPGEPGEAKIPEKADPNKPEEPVAAPPGGKDLGLEKAKKYGPDDVEIQGLDKNPDDPNTPGGDVNVDKSKPAEGEPGYLPANPTPVVLDHESGFNKSEKAEDALQVKGGLGIPATVLKGSGKDKEDDEDKAEASTKEIILEAVTEQQELLDAFAKLASEMNQLLLGFENSTFVKRLKAASRKQMDFAVELNELDGFGVTPDEADTAQQRKTLADRQVAESEKLSTLQQDMMAYAARQPSPHYELVLEEMQNDDPAIRVRDIGSTIQKNDVGQATIDSEFWADTLDRYAEQLVPPPPSAHGPPPEGVIDLPNLTHEIVLEVLRVINREIELREETRELHQTVPLAERDENGNPKPRKQGEKEEPEWFADYNKRAAGLSKTQQELAATSRNLVEQIKKLPRADHPKILGQIAKLTEAAKIMDEVEDLLDKPDTSPTTVAAIQHAIETLLAAGRLPNAPMIAKVPPSSTPALMLMGLGDGGSKVSIEKRAPGQGTGKTGRKLPAEFRAGLDVYLNKLEGR